MAIDFNAITRGRRAARADEQAEIAARRADEEYRFGREERRQQYEENMWNRQAAGYTANLLANMQRAADAGQNDLEYLIAQRTAVMQDPTFASFAPEVQERILKRLGEAAQLTAQQHLQAGDPSAARRLYDAFGWGAQIPERETAFRSGDTNAIIAAIDPNRTLLQDNGDGTFTYRPTGQVMRADRLAAAAQAGGGAQVLPLLSATLYQEAQAAEQAQAWQIQLQEQALMSQGYMKQADGSWRHLDGRVLPPLTAPGTPAPAGAAPGAAPGGSVPAAAAPRVPAPAPAGAAPDVPAAIARLQEALAATTAVPPRSLEQLEAERRALEARLDVIAPWMDQAGGDYMGAAFEPARTPMRGFPAPRDRAEYDTLIQQLTDVQDEIQRTRGAAATARDGVAPADAALATTLRRAGPAAWADTLLQQQIVTAGDTLPAAQNTVRNSPATAQAYLDMVVARLAELQGVQGKEREVVKLITVRDNLQTALAAARRR